MKNINIFKKYKGMRIPLIIERGENGFYVVECPIFSGCYTQGKTIDEAMANIREVLELVLEEKENQKILESRNFNEIKLETITL
jgi:predicted RNase H-like HicB family nuclease